MKKTIISIVLAVMLLLTALPMTAFAAEADVAETGVTVFNVTDADHLRSALQTVGDITVNIMNDIEFTMPDGYQWSNYNGAKSNYSYWSYIAEGNKTINLKGHRVYITDNQIEKAKYTRSTYSYNGATYKLDVLEPNGYVRNGCMFRIPAGSSLTVNGKEAKSEIMFDAQMAAYDQLIDYNVVTQRDLFEINGGSLTLNGGEYQAGRRKTVHVTSAVKKKADWSAVDGILWPTTHYYGNGEYCIGGSVIVAESGDATVNGGTLIAHGYSYPASNCRNAVLRVADGHIRVNDGIMKGYCGADVVRDNSSGDITIYSGEAIAEAPDQYLHPNGHYAVSTESNYCAVACGAGASYIGGVKAAYTDTSTTIRDNNDVVSIYNKTVYTPYDRTSGTPRWEDGTSEVRTIVAGHPQKVIYDAAESYFPMDNIPCADHYVTYSWALQKLNESNKWSDVGDRISTGGNNSKIISADTLVSGATYRISARMEEYWKSDHTYTIKVQSANHLVFKASSAQDYVIDSIDISFPAPVGGKELSFDTSLVTGLPQHTVCDQIAWYDSNNSMKYSGDIAETGKQYEVWIGLTPTVGSFAQRSTLEKNAKVNGQKAGIVSGNGSIWVKYTYPAAEGPAAPTQIKSVEIKVTEPVLGQVPVYNAYVPNDYGYVVEDYNVLPYKYGVAWFHSNGGEMRADEVFEAGHSYRVNVSLIPTSESYVFATSGINATVNGKKAAAEAYNDWTAEQNIGVSYTYTFTKKLKNVDAFITEPAAGQTPSYVASVPEGADYEVEDFDQQAYCDGVAWYRPDGTEMQPTDTFEVGGRYTVYISLITTYNGCEFAVSDLVGTLNGQIAAAGAYEDETETNNVYVRYTFTVRENTSQTILLGDADDDGEVTILDATTIQRKLASLSVDSYNEKAADADEDGEITILDATFIQRWLAGLSSNENIGKLV